MADEGFTEDPEAPLADPAVTDFVEVVREWCAWADGPPCDARSEAVTARRLLARLYGCCHWGEHAVEALWILDH